MPAPINRRQATRRPFQGNQTSMKAGWDLMDILKGQTQIWVLSQSIQI